MATPSPSSLPADTPKWTRKVSLTPDTRCRGLAVSLQGEKSGEAARLSVFVDDAQFVELRRAASVEELVQMRRRLRDPHQVARIFETRAQAEQHFVLAVGPLDGAAVQRVRWAALQAGLTVQVTLGDDYRGDPMKPGRP